MEERRGRLVRPCPLGPRNPTRADKLPMARVIFQPALRHPAEYPQGRPSTLPAMGIYDREYARDSHEYRPLSGGGFGAGRLMVTNIVIINVVLWLANYLFFNGSNQLMYGLSANVYSLVYPWLWWQLLTCGFAHSPHDFWHILGNMVGLWFLGREVERKLGSWEFLRFYLLAIVIGSVFHNLLYIAFEQQPWPDPYVFGAAGVLGASGAVTATIMLFVFYFPRVKVLLFFALPVPAWLVGVFVVGQDALGAATQAQAAPGEASRVAFHVHLIGAAFAFAYFYFRWNFGRMIPSSFGDAAARLRKSLRRKPKLRVHTGDDEPVAETRYEQQDEEADRVLGKLNREGMESLTDKERRTLEEYSRRMQQKHR